MFNLISYRATFCRNGRLAPDGQGLLQIECRQQRRTAYFSARVRVEPSQFSCGHVVNHPIADALNLRLRQMMWDLMAVEMDCVRRGVPCSLDTLREAWRESSRPTARLTDFGREFIDGSHAVRREMTRRAYQSLFNSLDKFRPSALVQDADYQFITRYEAWMKGRGLGHNTRVGRLRLLRAVMQEAVNRGIVHHNPFERYKIPGMVSKKGFLSAKHLAAIEQMNLLGKQAAARDLFLLSCYTGLRFSDVTTLRSQHLKDGWIVKRMQKTGHEVKVPVSTLFGGKAQQLIDRYGGIEGMTRRVECNATINRRLKVLFRMAGCDGQGFTFHTARHTFASLLLQQGVGMATIQRLLGHTQRQTTEIYAEVTQEVIEQDLLKATGGCGA